jgi:hypothetical protein
MKSVTRIPCSRSSVLRHAEAIAAINLPRNYPTARHTVIVIRDSFFKQRDVGNQSDSEFVRQIFPLYDDVVLYQPAYFHPLVDETYRYLEARSLLNAANDLSGT